ncbi:unnamed protein product [Dibothriocephalus latus]|uniref:Uncharacterized protein n=1 Tax=Dibothriocephalus latus TaxID=60516 RepID=A0A3P7QYI7_DIBLA|nr:unnamed protein product [Dibothriocephalus latus]
MEKKAYAKSMEEAMRKLDEEINAEKKKLMDEFTIWKANVFLPEIEEKAICANRAEREKRMIADNVTVRISGILEDPVNGVAKSQGGELWVKFIAGG